MKKTTKLAIIGFVLLNGSAIWLAVSESRNPHGHRVGAKACAECHPSDVPSVHTTDFVKKEHMAQSYLNWQACMTCHWRESCDDCHEKEESAPDFHTKEFKELAGEGRMQHVLYARMRPEGCMTCHEHRFAATCSQCHQPHKETQL